MAIRAESHERIVRAATLLFAEHGYHGVSARQIADAVGLNVATVHYHTGGKRELYLSVVRRLYEQEMALVTSVLDAQPADAWIHPPQLWAGLTSLVDALVDFLDQRPERARLYIRRWLEGADEMTPIEAELSLALHRPLLEILRRAHAAGAIRSDVDLTLFLRSFTWMLFSYFVTGPIDWQTWQGDPHEPASLDAFRAYLRDYLARMLGIVAATSSDVP
ncbi:MAG TPA: TetR family transcriptional regulator [Ktedonobacterales bacterium]|nr:TetR family transcriptional regulator [Ktedonobacterales bacterium]